MLFNVYYNGNTPTDFSIDLTESAIVKPNSIARLLKAYIPHKKAVTLATNKIMDLVVNDRNSNPIEINIAAAGTFSINNLATQVANAINAAMTGNNSNIVASCSYDRTKGHGAGAFTINIKATSRYFSAIQAVDWNDDPYSQADYIEEEVVAGVTQDCVYTKLDTDALNMTVIDVATGNPPTVGTFAQAGLINEELKLDYFSKNNDPTTPYPPSQYGEYGCIIYELGEDIGTRSFWAGCYNGVGNVTDRQPINDVGKLDELNNVPFAMFVPKTTRGAGSANNSGTVTYTAGGFYAWELNDTGDLTNVSNVNLGLGAGDQIAAVVSEGQHVEYYYKKPAVLDQWVKIDVIEGRERYIVQTHDTLCPAFSIFEPTTTDQRVLRFLGGSIDSGDLNEYGRYIESSLTDTFAIALGFTSSPYITTDDEALANLKFSNEKEFEIVETTEDCPFVNINITNLPLKGYCNYDTARVGLSNIPNLGTVSRFDRDGSMTKPEALYMDYPTHSVALNNANELYLSQLKFQLRDNDGKIPTDLDSPLSIVFEIDESR